MTPENEEARETPISQAPEADQHPTSIPESEPVCPLHRTIEDCAAADVAALLNPNPDDERFAPGADVAAHKARILSRCAVSVGSLYRFATYAPRSTAFHELVAFHSNPRDRRLDNALLRLWKSGALPFFVLIVNLRDGELEIGVDTIGAEALAAYERKVAAISWALPWRLRVVALPFSTAELAGDAGLGLRYPTGGGE